MTQGRATQVVCHRVASASGASGRTDVREQRSGEHRPLSRLPGPRRVISSPTVETVGYLRVSLARQTRKPLDVIRLADVDGLCPARDTRESPCESSLGLRMTRSLKSRLGVKTIRRLDVAESSTAEKTDQPPSTLVLIWSSYATLSE